MGRLLGIAGAGWGCFGLAWGWWGLLGLGYNRYTRTTLHGMQYVLYDPVPCCPIAGQASTSSQRRCIRHPLPQTTSPLMPRHRTCLATRLFCLCVFARQHALLTSAPNCCLHTGSPCSPRPARATCRPPSRPVHLQYLPRCRCPSVSRTLPAPYPLPTHTPPRRSPMADAGLHDHIHSHPTPSWLSLPPPG